MNNKTYFQQQGFSVIDSENTENKLLQFLKEYYPQTIVGEELKIEELKAILGIPFDEKTNGYGLNFVGRNVARAKYAQPTQKELRLNTALSKDIDTTQNLVLKGDNLDSLKILKNHYTNKIKCIYIDPPYNTQSDEFIYPDKFDKEEAEALGIAENLSDEDFARMEFSFNTKKSHNGWLAFMYPRLLLARDLLSKDGVIFISIDDNEQANLKILCDEIFGEENFVGGFIVVRSEGGGLAKQAVIGHDYLLIYAKNVSQFVPLGKPKDIRGEIVDIDNEKYWIETDWLRKEFGKYGTLCYEDILAIKGEDKKNEIDKGIEDKRYILIKKGNKHIVGRYRKVSEDSSKFYTILKHLNKKGVEDLKEIGMDKYFDFPKPTSLLKELILGATIKDKNAIILDFFAGSGTTGHAVMALNAEDGGNRKFILCQIDEPIAENKPAYQFCMDNALPPFISSITIERLKRAGEQIGSGDTGFKVFDSANSPNLTIEGENILFPDLETDALSRIYNMIFSVGVDEPSQTPEVVQEDSVYRIGNHYYITNSEKVSKEDFAKYLSPENKVYVDGWTASLNATLQHYKDEVKIVF